VKPHPPPTAVLRFGSHALDERTGELRKEGALVRLPPQPAKVLALLARHSGRVVTREEIQREIWYGDTFVDFEQGLNFCVRQIRDALGDHADRPQFIETLPRRGYRFLLPVDVQTERAPATVTRLIVLPFRMLRPDPETDFLAFSLPDAVTSSLSGLESIVVRSSIAASRFGSEPQPTTIAAEADVDVVLTGSLLRAGDRIRVSTQLTEVPAGTLLWSHTSQVAIGDLFQVQDELATRIVESLSLPLSARDHRILKGDVPRSSNAYELYLRANQLSQSSKEWARARDLYVRCVGEDPAYAPAWARLGRIHHVLGKYVDADGSASFDQAAVAFKRALEINQDLPLAHKLYAQLQVDVGQAREAMLRLLAHARSADPEIFAGLVSVCRYCGLLAASAAADVAAKKLDARVRTSVVHTWFLNAEYARVVATTFDENPYIVALSLASLGRTSEAIALARELERTIQTRLKDFVIAARSSLEGKPAESVAAIERIVSSGFRDPEGLFYLTRHLVHLKQEQRALDLFQRVVAGGFCCYPAMARDGWLDPIRQRPAFAEILGQAESQHREAAAAFAEAHGDARLGLRAVPTAL
jgi:DNA-binding winged helix-turn-helix (wHTH) protein/tetratricopeptide (TPR) repeat protein